MLQFIINRLGLESYYFAVAKNSEHNTTGKVELWTLNSEGPIALGYKDSIKELQSYAAAR